jgi:glycosyltransferase involved in cell wall biosynthesis
MHKDPLVSVLIPAYNAEPFIERTLRSVLNQTHTNLEILIIDDGSTDKTRAITEAVVAGDHRVRIISVANGGVAKARNIGIEESTAPFVAFLDADDLWHPTKVQMQLAALTARGSERAAAAYALHRVIDADDRVVKKGNSFACSGYALARLLYAKFIGNGSSLLVSREAAVAVGGFESSWAARGIGGCEDLDFELKIAARYPIVAVPHFLVGYRVTPGNMSSDKTRMARAVVATLEHHCRVNSQLPNYAVAKARGSTREYALSLLVFEKRWKLAFAEFAHLFVNDTSRAVDFGTALIARKMRKMQVREPEQAPVAGPHFTTLDAGSIEDPGEAASGRRDLDYMERLARIDRALARKLDIVERPMDVVPRPAAASDHC